MNYEEVEKELDNLKDYILNEIDKNEKLANPMQLLVIDFDETIRKLSLCESPIEKIMLLNLESISKSRGRVIPQYSFDDYNYRVDFYLKLDQNVNIVVECDGHDYHEKTKKQAKRDKKRDRKLQQIPEVDFVFRFTGSEIYNNPEKCASEIEEAFINLGLKRYKRNKVGD